MHSHPTDIAQDLAHTMVRIHACLGAAPDGRTAAAPDLEPLHAAAQLLQGFALRHIEQLHFQDFPLPEGAQDALADYVLYDDPATGMILSAKAIRGGVDSAVHEHGTWAIIAGLHGQERNRIYTPPCATAYAGPQFSHEVVVDRHQALVMPAGLFHSIHTAPHVPALQLHLYGRALETVGPRCAYDADSGALSLLR